MKTPTLCRFGMHKDEILNLDGTPAGPWMVMYQLYKYKCQRCGREEQFTFWIDRSSI